MQNTWYLTQKSNRERAAKAAADEKAASDKQTAANKASAEKRKKDAEEAYRNQVEAIRQWKMRVLT